MLPNEVMAKRKRYVKPADPGLFDSMDRLSRLDSMADPLANLSAVMNWEHSRQLKARIPDSTGDWRARLSRVMCLGSGLKAATSARSVDFTRCTASRS